MPNQHKPNPPLDELAPHIFKYHRHRMPRTEMVKVLLNSHIDEDKYGLSYSALKRMFTKLGIVGTRNQHHTVQTIHPAVIDIRRRFPTIGSREIINILALNYDIRVPRPIVLQWCRENEPDAVTLRRMRKFVRRIFYSAGVNHVWAFDQHDKWRRFHVFLHIGLDIQSRKILWLRVWSSNSNPRLPAKYYLDVVEKIGGVPLLSQSDLGTENYGIANAQTSIRQHLDNSLAGTLQHRWMRGHDNVKPEIAWSQFRRRCAPGFEDEMQKGLDAGWYNPADDFHRMLFHWLAIPWLQAEIDAFVERFNMTKPRFNKRVLTPHGAPDIIYDNPNLFDTHDFKVIVPPEVIQEARQNWAPPEHEIFRLVPELFERQVLRLYSDIGNPIVTMDTFWPIYLELLRRFTLVPGGDLVIQEIQDEYEQLQVSQRLDIPVNILPNQAEWRGEAQGAFIQQPRAQSAQRDTDWDDDDEIEDRFVFFPDDDDVDEPY